MKGQNNMRRIVTSLAVAVGVFLLSLAQAQDLERALRSLDETYGAVTNVGNLRQRRREVLSQQSKSQLRAVHQRLSKRDDIGQDQTDRLALPKPPRKPPA